MAECKSRSWLTSRLFEMSAHSSCLSWDTRGVRRRAAVVVATAAPVAASGLKLLAEYRRVREKMFKLLGRFDSLKKQRCQTRLIKHLSPILSKSDLDGELAIGWAELMLPASWLILPLCWWDGPGLATLMIGALEHLFNGESKSILALLLARHLVRESSFWSLYLSSTHSALATVFVRDFILKKEFSPFRHFSATIFRSLVN